MPVNEVDIPAYDSLLAEKATRVIARFKAFEIPEVTVVPSPPAGFRMRAEFRMWHDGDALDYVMFDPDTPRVPVPIREFPIACAPIQRLMALLQPRLAAEPELRRKLFQVEFLSTLAGDSLVSLVYHRPLGEAWERLAQDLASALDISIVGRSRKQKLVVGRDYVMERLCINNREYRYQQFEQAFTQPNASVNTRMIEWAVDSARNFTGDLLELYCGNGNFTLPLAACFDNVIATELAKVSTRAARFNIRENAIENVHVVRLAAAEVSEAMAGTREFRRLADLPRPLGDFALDTVFVDPPRAGLDEATLNMVGGFPRIMYISCNPETLAANLQTLYRSHRIERFALFDQFPYTGHMECGVSLVAR